MLPASFFRMLQAIGVLYYAAGGVSALILFKLMLLGAAGAPGRLLRRDIISLILSAVPAGLVYLVATHVPVPRGEANYILAAGLVFSAISASITLATWIRYLFDNSYDPSFAFVPALGAVLTLFAAPFLIFVVEIGVTDGQGCPLYRHEIYCWINNNEGFFFTPLSLAIAFILGLLPYQENTASAPHLEPAPAAQPEPTVARANDPVAPPPPSTSHPAQPIVSSPSKKPESATRASDMALRLRRSERQGTFGTVIFALDARMEVSAEVHALIHKYRLGSTLIYESKNRAKYARAAQEHFEGAHSRTSIFDPTGAQLLDAARGWSKIGRGAFSALASALALKITVSSLIQGHHIECKDMAELLDAEDQIAQAAQNLKHYIEAARSFSGRESVIEF